LEYVDEDQLINFLGGKCNAELLDDHGPWNDYEIVDSAEPGAKVGIRKKGEEEIIFSADDLMKLPNYKTSG
jgi:hypothetical protein